MSKIGTRLLAVSVGYDQRLYLWNLLESKVDFVSGSVVNISDIGSLDTILAVKRDSLWCVVAGEGVQLVRIKNLV